MQLPNSENGGKQKGSESPNNSGPVSGKVFHLTTQEDPMGLNHSISNPPVEGRVAGTQSTGEQDRLVRQTIHGVIGHDSTDLSSSLFTKDSMKKATKARKIKEMRPSVNSHLNIGITPSNVNYPRRCPKNSEPQNGREVKVAEASAENLSTPEAEQGRA